MGGVWKRRALTFVLVQVVEWVIAHLADRMDGPEEEANTSNAAGCGQGCDPQMKNRWE